MDRGVTARCSPASRAERRVPARGGSADGNGGSLGPWFADPSGRSEHAHREA